MTEEELKQHAHHELVAAKNALYLFDFDGTIYPRDSMMEFLKIHVGTTKFYLTLPLMVFPTIKFFFHKDKTLWKSDFLNLFLKNQSRQQLSESAILFSQIHQNLIFSQALEYIKLIKRHNTVCIVSASLDIWLEPIIAHLGVDLICTHPKFINNQFKGIDGYNCNAEEKVKQIKLRYDLTQFEQIISFGNSAGDIPMYQISDKFYHKKFN